MGDSNTIRVLKSAETKNIKVLYAASLKDQIRFYINETEYIAAVEVDNKYIRTGWGKADQSEYEIDKKKKKEFFKNNFWKCIGYFFLMILMILPAIAMMWFLAYTLRGSIFIYILLINTFMFLYKVGQSFILEYITTPRILKRKHAAEHMIINFMEANNRLPMTTEEVSKYSRISDACGSRKIMEGCATCFIDDMIVCFSTIIVSCITLWITKSTVIELIVFLLVYLVLNILFKTKKLKIKHLSGLTKPIDKVLFRFIQYANTTKKYVTQSDIVLAYKSAKPWVQLVYPEYYNEEEDIFESIYLKDVNVVDN